MNGIQMSFLKIQIENIVIGVLFVSVFILIMTFIVLVVLAIKDTVLKIKMNYIKKHELDVPYETINYRDIPFKGDFVLPYYVAFKEGIMVSNGLISAFILKWLHEKRIVFVPLEKELFDFNKIDNYYIDISKLEVSKNYEETVLIQYMRNASEDGKILYLEKFKIWCSKNAGSIRDWWELVKEKSKEKLIKEGYIIENLGYALRNNLSSSIIYTDAFKDEMVKLKGLKMFLNNMSEMDSKKVNDVHLWDEYLIFAAAFGLTNVISKQLNGFLPNETINSI